jgi:hypothetical protein
VKRSFAGNSSQVRYVFDKEIGRYERYNGDAPHTVEGPDGGAHLGFSNVIVQMVGVSAGGTIDRAGERSTDIRMLGSGSVVLFRGGRALRGTWQRAGAGDVTRFVGTNGQTLKLAPGTTMVELLPQGREIFVT